MMPSPSMVPSLAEHWMAGGVLLAVLAAVLAPALGAPGGVLHAQYTRIVPLWYIQWSGGVRAGAAWRAQRGACSGRVVGVTCAHAAVLAPVLAVLLLSSAPTDPLLRGLLATAAGAPCPWLSLAVCGAGEEVAPLLAALLYAASLLTAPAAMLLLCGRAPVPALSEVAGAAAGALPPFLAGAATGALRRASADNVGAMKACALVLVYAQCCEALAARGGGALPPLDLLAALGLEACWLGLCAGACWGYSRAGVLSRAEARLVAACALPKAADVGWACNEGALARLPALFLPPAQALLLAALPAVHAR